MLPWLSEMYAQLAKRVATDQLHHALIIEGQKGVGKQALAEALTAFLLCKKPDGLLPCGACQDCRLLSAGHHPDNYHIAPEQSIGVDSVREKLTQLMGTSQMSGARVLQIHQAHLMTEAAANSLLKTLEEPPAKTFLLLITNQKHRLLPTVLSRCEQHHLRPPSREVTTLWLSQQGHDHVPEDVFLAFDEAPLLIKNGLDEGFADKFSVLGAQLQSFLEGHVDVIGLAKQWKDNEQQMLAWSQKIMYKWAMSGNTKAWHGYQTLTEGARAMLQTGVNRQLLLSNLLTSLRG